MELFANEEISHITSGVGVPLSMDKATKMRNRLSFARICVEVDREASLPSSIHVDIEDFGSIEVSVIYPWRPRTGLFVRNLVMILPLAEITQRNGDQ